MKKRNLLFILFIIIFRVSFSQNHFDNGIKVIYKVGVIKNETTNNGEVNRTKKIITDVNKSIDLLEYFLFCNYESSIYFPNKKLKIKESFSDRMAYGIGGKDLFYKNIKENLKIRQRESSGHKFIIKYPFKQDSWEITKETKTINGYTCFKAISYREEMDYKTGTKKIFSPEVWFTPEIPLPFGPKGLDGLPGLVLEGTINGKTYYFATNINFDCTNCQKAIKKPTKGKHILKDDYFKLIAKKTD